MLFRVLFLGLVLAPLARAGHPVYLVDEAGGAGVDFTSLQVAVAEAEAGATLLVHTGDYGSIAPAGPLVLHAAPGATVRLATLTLIGLDDERGFVVRGASIEKILVHDCDAPIWFEACTVRDPGVAFAGFTPPGPAVDVYSSPSVVFLRSSISQQRASCPGEPCLASLAGGMALWVHESEVYLYDTDVTGGEAAFVPGTRPQGAHGGAGATLSDGFLFASGGSLRGGAGSIGAADFGCGVVEAPGPGGHGVVIWEGGASRFVSDGARLEGGLQGLPFTPAGLACVPPEVQQADPILALSGTVTELDGFPRSFAAESPVSGSLELEFTGYAGDAVVLGVGLRQRATFLEPLGGALLLERPFRAGYVGTVKLDTKQLELPIPGVPAGTRFYAQALFVDDAGEMALAGGSMVLVVD